MSQIVEETPEEELVPGASGCLVALVVIAMFACYGLGIFTGSYGQRYLDGRKTKNEEHVAFPDAPPEGQENAPAQPAEKPLAQPVSVDHDGARITLDLATARFTRGGGSGEVKLPGLLLVRLRVKNLTVRPLEFLSWMHADVRTWLAQLVDNQNQTLDSIHDADNRVGIYLMSLPQYRPALTLAPGEETTTWVAFSISKRPVGALRLSLSAVNYGGDGLINLDIPAGAVTEGNPID
jgi:phage baseplate assembly protein gpV